MSAKALRVKCIDCKHLQVEYEDEKGATRRNQLARARCLIKAPPKKGKIINWAYTTYASVGDAFANRPLEYGLDRVQEEMDKKKCAPRWCPLHTELADDGKEGENP